MVLILSVTTMGFAVSQHYCGNRLVSVSVNETADSCCGPVGNCCQNEIIHLQIEDDFLVDVTYQTTQIKDYTIFSYAVVDVISTENYSEITSKDRFSDSCPVRDLPTYLATIQSYLL